MAKYTFRKYPPFTDGEIDVLVAMEVPANPLKGYVPVYKCAIHLHGTKIRVGIINLRVGYTDLVVQYGGNLGYEIEEPYRGHGYAAKACKLILTIARDNQMDSLWITCNPDNLASRKTCENIGCEFVEIIDLPPNNAMYERGERKKCRYRWVVHPLSHSA